MIDNDYIMYSIVCSYDNDDNDIVIITIMLSSLYLIIFIIIEVTNNRFYLAIVSAIQLNF